MYLLDNNVLNIMTAMNFMTITNWLALSIRFCVLYMFYLIIIPRNAIGTNTVRKCEHI